MGANEKELKKLNTFITHALNASNRVFKETVKEFGKRLVNRTPVLEIQKERQGQTKANYVASIGTPDITYNESARDPSGQNTINNIATVVEGAPPNSTIYISNAVPWIEKLELGNYSSPVLRGTRGDDGNYYIRSSGGWSKQLKALGSPYGMGAVTSLEFPGIAEEMKRKYG